MPRPALTRRAAVVVLTAATFFITVSLVAPSPLYPLWQSKFGFTSLGVTVVFSVYVGAMLVTLLIAGALSDSLGRKPVILIALGCATLAMVLFLLADGFTTLIVARILQGITFGLSSGALTAALVEIAATPAIGAMLGVFCQSIALAVGTLGSGLLVQLAPYPFQLVFVLLLVLFVLAGVGVIWTRESNDTRHLATHSWKPRIAVPRAVLPRFLQLVPGMAATMALNGFYLSLGPSLANTMLQTSSPFAGGLLMFCITGPGVASAVVFRGRSVRASLMLAGGLMAAGTLVTFIALIAANVPLLYLGTAIAGLGWGASAGSVSKALAIVTPQHQRGGVFAALMIVSYVAFSVPVLIAGGFVNAFGLMSTAPVYILVILVIALVSATWASRLPPDVSANSPAKDVQSAR